MIAHTRRILTELTEAGLKYLTISLMITMLSIFQSKILEDTYNC